MFQNAAASLITFKNVTVTDNSQTIIENISFSVQEGEKLALYGKSGSGKTTILNTIVGAHVPCRGEVCFCGEKLTPDNISKLRRAVAFIGQEPVMGAEKVLDAILLPYTFKANRANIPARETIQNTLKNLHLDVSILQRSSSVVSGGEKQRIAVARALLQGKKIFILDEITSALDDESRKAVLDLFGKANITLISVSHDRQWWNICSKLVCIEKGRMVEKLPHGQEN